MLRILRLAAIALACASAFGLLNAFYLKIYGLGGDLGVIAGVLARLAWAECARKSSG